MSKRYFFSAVLIILYIHFSPSAVYISDYKIEPFSGIVPAQILFAEDVIKATPALQEEIPFYGNSRMNKVVFGYLPEWMLNTARSYLQYNLLTHIAIFPFNVKSNGDLSYPKDWPWNDVIKKAHLNDVKVILTVFSQDMNTIHILLTNEKLKLRFFETLRNTLIKYKLDGVNIDFESLRGEDKSVRINTFMKDLTEYLHTHIPDSEVSIAGPAVNWDGMWDLSELATSCDYIFVMSYCYFGSWSKISGPAATLTGRKYCIDSTFTNRQTGYGSILEKQPESLVLGVPYYSNYWITQTQEPHSPVNRFLGNLTYIEAAEFASKYARMWHEDYNVPWYLAEVNGEWHQLWFDGPVSIGLKFDYAISKQLRGVGIWALGFDKDRKELWNLIDDKFSIEVPAVLAERAVPSKDNDLTIVDSSATVVAIVDSSTTAIAVIINEIDQGEFNEKESE